jgi:hypothetical protein
MTNEKIQFRLFVMPCCKYQLCWVNPRLPSHCPDCGKAVYIRLKQGNCTLMDSPAWLKIEDVTFKIGDKNEQIL